MNQLINLIIKVLHFFLSFFISENKLLKWKPIHLCWWFEKNNLPIPKYFIGTPTTTPSVTTNAATSITATTATGNGNITSDGGVAIDERGFVFSITSVNNNPIKGGTGVTTIVEGGTTTGSYSDTLETLVSSTNYSYKAYAHNSKGDGYGSVQTFNTTAAFSATQVRFRFYADGTESGSTPLANEGVDLSGSTAIATVAQTWTGHLRILLQETGGVAGASTDDYQLYYSKNSAAYAAVTSTSNNVKTYAGTLTDQEATTNRSTGLTDGTGSFVAGKVDEANGEITDVQITASNFTELLWSIQLVSADLASADTLDFKVYRNSAVITTYTDIPRITVSKGSSPTVTLNTPSDTGTITDTTPALLFTGTDANSDDIRYNLQLDTANTFDSQGSAGTYAVTTANSWLEYNTNDNSDGISSCSIDSNHFINFWQGLDFDGYVQVFTVNTTTWAVTTANSSLEFETVQDNYNSCYQIDSNHFINFFEGESFDGYVQVFTVNTTTWAVTTANSSLEFETQYNFYNSCYQIDSNHFINFWGGVDTDGGSTYDGYVQVFTVNTTTWAVTTANASLEFDTVQGNNNSCYQIDSNHFINFYKGLDSDGYVQVFTVNTTTWAVTTSNASLEFDTANGSSNSCYQIDSNHFINFWAGLDSDGYVQAFTVNTTTWAVTTANSSLEYDTVLGALNSCYQIDSNHFINFWSGGTQDGYVQVFTVNTTTWAVTTANSSLWFDTQNVISDSCCQIDSNHFINFWGGVNEDGFVQVFTVDIPAGAGAPLIDDTSNVETTYFTRTGDSDPFTSGEAVTYTVQAGDTLDPDTYYWRVRGLDPSGTNTYGSWSSTYSFTVSAAEASVLTGNYIYMIVSNA